MSDTPLTDAFYAGPFSVEALVAFARNMEKQKGLLQLKIDVMSAYRPDPTEARAQYYLSRDAHRQMQEIIDSEFDRNKKLIEENGALVKAVLASVEVFHELDIASWPQNEADGFFGRTGSCPVDYDEAQRLCLAVHPSRPTISNDDIKTQ